MRLEEDEEPGMMDSVLEQLTHKLNDADAITLGSTRAIQLVFVIIASYCKLEDVVENLEWTPTPAPSALRSALEDAHFGNIVEAYTEADFTMSVGIPAGRFQAAPKELPRLLIEVRTAKAQTQYN